LETTGTKHWRNGIHQISGIIEIDGEEKESFNFNVQPNKDAEIDSEALNVSGVTKEKIQLYPPMNEVHTKINEMLSKYCDRYNKTDKFFLTGYNISQFDNQFFRAFFVQNFDQYFGSWFWSDSHDVMILASERLKSIRHTMPNFQLRTVAKFLGIKVDETKLHDALYDIRLTKQIYEIIINRKG
jgi:DNA polymerase III subunit epsilon